MQRGQIPHSSDGCSAAHGVPSLRILVGERSSRRNCLKVEDLHKAGQIRVAVQVAKSKKTSERYLDSEGKKLSPKSACTTSCILSDSEGYSS